MNEQELIWSAVIAWMSAKGIQVAKMLPWMPINVTTERLNRWAARLVAMSATIGIHSTFDSTAGVLTISGLTWSGVFLSIGEYAKQFMLQEVAYKKFVREKR